MKENLTLEELESSHYDLEIELTHWKTICIDLQARVYTLENMLKESVVIHNEEYEKRVEEMNKIIEEDMKEEEKERSG